MKLDLEHVNSKVKPGMLLCDDRKMTLVLRDKVKAEYLDFNRQHKETMELRKRC